MLASQNKKKRLFCSARQAGATTAITVEAIKKLCSKPGQTAVYVCQQQAARDTAKRLFAELAKNAIKKVLRDKIEFLNGSEIVFCGVSELGFRGRYFDHVYFDNYRSEYAYTLDTLELCTIHKNGTVTVVTNIEEMHLPNYDRIELGSSTNWRWYNAS